jgi:hypothetical protein
MNIQKENTMTVPFDTLAYAKKLEASGIEPKQAEAHAESLAEVLEKRFTPKKDWGQSIIDLDQSVITRFNEMDTKINVLRNDMDNRFDAMDTKINVLRCDMDNRFDALRNDMDARFNIVDVKFGELRAEMNGKFLEVKSEVVKWVFGISFAQAALIVSLLKFFH